MNGIKSQLFSIPWDPIEYWKSKHIFEWFNVLKPYQDLNNLLPPCFCIIEAISSFVGIGFLKKFLKEPFTN